MLRFISLTMSIIVSSLRKHETKCYENYYRPSDHSYIHTQNRSTNTTSSLDNIRSKICR